MGTGDSAGGVGEFLPEFGVGWEIEPFVPLFLQNLRMFLTLTMEVLRARESLPGTRLFELWSSEVESNENLLDGVLSSLMTVEDMDDFLALWVGRVGISGTAGTGGTSSNGMNDEGYLPKGSGESGMIGDSRDRGGWREGYKASSSLCFASGSSGMSGDEPFLLGNDLGGCIATPFKAHCGWLAGSASNREPRASDVNAECGTTGQVVSSG